MFWKPALFPSLGKEAPNVADPSDRVILSLGTTETVTSYNIHLRTNLVHRQ